MKRFCVIFCMLTLIGCSTLGNIKMEDLNDVEQRLLQLSMVIGENDDLDEALSLLEKAKQALDIEDKVAAKEYRDAVLVLMDILEE